MVGQARTDEQNLAGERHRSVVICSSDLVSAASVSNYSCSVRSLTFKCVERRFRERCRIGDLDVVDPSRSREIGGVAYFISREAKSDWQIRRGEELTSS